MLSKAKNLKGYKLDSLDGEIGKVKEFYFDDLHWTIRYLVAETGNWLMDRQVLISPYALVAVIRKDKHISINLTKKQIEDSPHLDRDKPVSQQFEETYHVYYGWPRYWGGPYMWGFYPSFPSTWGAYTNIVPDRETMEKDTQDEKRGDLNLRSTREVTGYNIQATDGEIGHVEDFIIDDEMWAIRYLIVDTRNWWPGKKVLISPQWIKSISWGDSKVFVNLSRDAIRNSPEYTEGTMPTRDYESKLHGHYNSQGYWVDEAIATRQSK